MMNVLDFSARKCAGEKISMVTCYDFWSARILNSSDIDTLLVGDSLAMIMHGYDSTVHATVDMMATHIAAVRKGAPGKFVVGDMPFLSVRKGLVNALDAVAKLMQAGSHCVKIEGAQGQLDVMEHIIESGVPVMGHLGLMPQSVQAFGGHKVQGRNKHAADKILDAAKSLEQAGCFALVLECIPADLGKLITQQLSIPTIGIGAGSHTDGQVLVLHDLLGMDDSFKPKFLRHYLCGNASVRSAVNHYHADVHAGLFPSAKETYA
ncbi:MAG: 3-methyl-2-oxobutanoate hydroxymethyltransferase [Gammaproteobacteria bacterium]|nr:3-methyl-2-oxobutanoate hydroxymethyltransferase [Gammaproteobacteria bacterium]